MGWVEDGSGFSAEQGITALELLGKLPSGEERVIGSMGIDQDYLFSSEPHLVLYMQPEVPSYVSWDSADAALFLKLAELAIEQQPQDNLYSHQ